MSLKGATYLTREKVMPLLAENDGEMEYDYAAISNSLPMKHSSCSCCPYGYHIDLDFVKYAQNCHVASQAPGSGRSTMINFKKNRKWPQRLLYQPESNRLSRSNRFENFKDSRRSEAADQRLQSPGTPLENPIESPQSNSMFSDSWDNLVSDFEETLSRSSGTLPRNMSGITEKEYCSDNDVEANFGKYGFRTPAVKASSGRSDGYASDYAYQPPKRRMALQNFPLNDPKSGGGPKPFLENRVTARNNVRESCSYSPFLARSLSKPYDKSGGYKKSVTSITLLPNLSGQVAKDLHTLSDCMSPALSDSERTTDKNGARRQRKQGSISDLLEAVQRHMNTSLSHIEHLENQMGLSPRLSSQITDLKEERNHIRKELEFAIRLLSEEHLDLPRHPGSTSSTTERSRLPETDYRSALAKPPLPTRMSSAPATPVRQRNEGESASSSVVSRDTSFGAFQFQRSASDLTQGRKHGTLGALDVNIFPSVRRSSTGSNGQSRHLNDVSYASDSEVSVVGRNAIRAASLRRSKHLLSYTGKITDLVKPDGKSNGSSNFALSNCTTTYANKAQHHSDTNSTSNGLQQLEASLLLRNTFTPSNNSKSMDGVDAYTAEKEKALMSKPTIQTSEVGPAAENALPGGIAVAQNPGLAAETDRGASPKTIGVQVELSSCDVCQRCREKNVACQATNTDVLQRQDVGTLTLQDNVICSEKVPKELPKATVTCSVGTDSSQMRCQGMNTDYKETTSSGMNTDHVELVDASSEIDKSIFLEFGYLKDAGVVTDSPMTASIGFNVDLLPKPIAKKTCDGSCNTDVDFEQMKRPHAVCSTGTQAVSEITNRGCSPEPVKKSTVDMCTSTDSEPKMVNGTNHETLTEKTTICVGPIVSVPPCRKVSVETNTEKRTLVDSCSMTNAAVIMRQNAEGNAEMSRESVSTKETPLPSGSQAQTSGMDLTFSSGNSPIPVCPPRRQHSIRKQQESQDRNRQGATPIEVGEAGAQVIPSEKLAWDHAQPPHCDIVSNESSGEEGGSSFREGYGENLNMEMYSGDEENYEIPHRSSSRSSGSKFDITKPKLTRAFNLSKAAAVKKLLTMQTQPNSSCFQRSTVASGSVRVPNRNKGNPCLYVENKYSKQGKATACSTVNTSMVAKRRPNASASKKSSKPGSSTKKSDESAKESRDTGEVYEKVPQDRFLKIRQDTMALSEDDSDAGTEASFDKQSTKTTYANSGNLDHSQQKNLEDAMQIIQKNLETPDSVDSLKLEWAKHYMQHTWLKTAARKTSDARQVETVLRLVESYGRKMLKYVLNICDQNRNTALHYSVSHGNFDIVSLLLDCEPCGLNTANKVGYTPVMLAALSADFTETSRMVMQRLFRLGDINIQTAEHGQTALMLAASNGKLDAVKMLLENHADANIQDKDGSTALICAAENGHADVVRTLLQTPRIDATLSDKDGGTAMSLAVDNGYKEIGLIIYAHMNNDLKLP